MKFILARKIGMTTIFEEDGKACNATLLETGKNIVLGVRTLKKEGYSAAVMGFLKDKKEADLKKRKNFSQVCEFSLGQEKEEEGLTAGQELTVEQFQIGDKVFLTGISKGKGFQGVMKRHNFSGSPATHGHRHDHRAPGSIGCAFPERVFPGKRMAGRMGVDRKTIKNVKIVFTDKEKGYLAVAGAVPGSAGTVVRIFS